MQGPVFYEQRYPEFPVQVIRQYAMQHLPALFRDIMHGVPMDRRTRPAFGIPTVKFTTTSGNSLPVVRWDGQTWQQGREYFSDGKGGGAPGEGCMLWHQEMPWVVRRGGGSLTTAILKFKPVLLATATVGSSGVEHSQYNQIVRSMISLQPQRSRVGGRMDGDVRGEDTRGGGGGGEEDGGELAGFHVHLVSAVSGEQQALKAYISAANSLAALQERYRVGTTVFFVFFMMERMPMYARAIGPRLNREETRNVQRGLTSSSPPSQPGLPPPLEELSRATSAWWSSRSTRCGGCFHWGYVEFIRNTLCWAGFHH
jgi:hypothetical protein